MAANPPGCAAALAALDVLVEENLSARANEMGGLLKSTIMSLKPPHLKEISGAGLFYALVLDKTSSKIDGKRLAASLTRRGLLVSSNRTGERVRICPPLTIDRETLVEGATIIADALKDLENFEE